MKTIQSLRLPLLLSACIILFLSSCTKQDLPLVADGSVDAVDQKEVSLFISSTHTEYQQVFLDIQKLEIKELASPDMQLGDNQLIGDLNTDDMIQSNDEFGAWKTCISAAGPTDLLSYANGNDFLLGNVYASNAISKIRVTLGENNYVIDHQGNRKPLLLDISNENSYYINLMQDDLDVYSGNQRIDLHIDIDLYKSIIDNGSSLEFTPHFRPYSISGYGEIKGNVLPVDVSTVVTVLDQNGFVTKSYPQSNGDFLFRGLIPDQVYTVKIEANGYQTQFIENLVAVKGSSISLDPVVLMR
jgi:hypothetical protein